MVSEAWAPASVPEIDATASGTEGMVGSGAGVVGSGEGVGLGGVGLGVGLGGVGLARWDGGAVR